MDSQEDLIGRRGREKLASNTISNSEHRIEEADLSSLVEIQDFGTNPGHLRMLLRVPTSFHAQPALIVCLHGCGQTASAFDTGGGWSVLAEQYGFLALFPEQQLNNNSGRCFNWFHPEDTQHDGGETLSIRQMVDYAISSYDIDPARIFITGLSAGGAMTSSLLASFPELFNAGAIVAGLPHGSAINFSEAIKAMSTGRERTAEQWGEIIRLSSTNAGPWPRISIWHGGLDSTVHPANANAIISQWLNLHDLKMQPCRDEVVGNHRVQVWNDSSGRDMVESHTIAGMGHGVPLAVTGQSDYGIAGPFHLDVGVSSSLRILGFFGLTDQPQGTCKKSS